MALSIPIVSEFDGSGVRKALKSFNQMESNSQRASAAVKLAWLGAAAGIAALAASAYKAGGELMSMVDAATEDQKSQKQLALSIRAATRATDSQIKSVEEFIDATQRQIGVADDKLRPAYARLVRSTKDVQQAQTLLTLALDISAATGKPLEAVANALGRAYDGQNTAIGRLGLGIDKATLKGLTFAELQDRLTRQFGGKAIENATTYEGRMATLRVKFDELKEVIGYKLLPKFEEMVSVGNRVADAFGMKGMAGAIQQIKWEIYSASPDNPFVQMLKKMYDGIKAVHDAWAQMQRGFARTGNFFRKLFVNSVPGYSKNWGEMQDMPTWEQLIGTPSPPLVNLPPGGTGIGPASPQGYVSAQSMSLGKAEQIVSQPITVQVTSADPRAVVDALVKYQRQNGAIPIAVR